MSSDKKYVRMYNLSRDINDSRDFVLHSKNAYDTSNHKDKQVKYQNEQLIKYASSNFTYRSVTNTLQ